MNDQRGIIHFYILLTIIGIVVFLFISSNAPLRDSLLSGIYPKPKSEAATNNDVTSQVENLGNPSKARYPDGGGREYARNVWDLQSFNGRIYIGSGNSSNMGPATNAGPVDLWYFDPAQNNFSKDTTMGSNFLCGTGCVDEEQIDIFEVINNQLMIPGHDARFEGWEMGNLYKLTGSGWQKFRNIPHSIHTYDLHLFQNKIFAAMGSESNLFPSVAISADNGQTWTSNIWGLNGSRIYSLFELGGVLYASTDMFNTTQVMLKYDGTSFSYLTDPQIDTFFPGSSATCPEMIKRPLNMQNKMIYLGACSVNDHQWIPTGLYVASSPTQVNKVNLPSGGLARDIILGEDGNAYVMATTNTDSTHYIITVNKSTDLTNWTEVFRFNTDTFARSFEQLNGDFYFGLGSNSDSVSPKTGEILKVSILNPSPLPTPSKKGDFNNSGTVNVLDLSVLLTNWGSSGTNQADLNNDSNVNILDLSILLTNWG